MNGCASRMELDVGLNEPLIVVFPSGPREIATRDGRNPSAAGLLLAHALAKDAVLAPGSLEGSRVLELGAGTGLPGMTAAKCGATRVVLTDRPQLINFMSKNVAENKLEFSVECMELDWADPKASLATQVRYDYVLAADVIRVQEGPADSTQAPATPSSPNIADAFRTFSPAVPDWLEQAMQQSSKTAEPPRSTRMSPLGDVLEDVVHSSTTFILAYQDKPHGCHASNVQSSFGAPNPRPPSETISEETAGLSRKYLSDNVLSHFEWSCMQYREAGMECKIFTCQRPTAVKLDTGTWTRKPFMVSRGGLHDPLHADWLRDVVDGRC